jgi:hypothetical protein
LLRRASDSCILRRTFSSIPATPLNESLRALLAGVSFVLQGLDASTNFS